VKYQEKIAMLEENNNIELAKGIMLSILKEFHKICVKHDLKYWLDSGTLLGAIRHNGFIPWDDDIDVCMPRDDYNKFLEIAPKVLPQNIIVQNYQTDNVYSFYYTKLRDADNIIIAKDEIKDEVKYHQGIFIDIFPMDIVSNKKIKAHRYWRKIIGLAFINRKYDKSLKNKIKYVLSGIVDFIGRERLKNIILRQCHGIENEYIVYGIELYSSLSTGRKFYIKKSKVLPLVKHLFEDEFFFIPNGYDIYLKKIYGEYMILPPEEKRVAPHSIEYRIITKRI